MTISLPKLKARVAAAVVRAARAVLEAQRVRPAVAVAVCLAFVIAALAAIHVYDAPRDGRPAELS